MRLDISPLKNALGGIVNTLTGQGTSSDTSAAWGLSRMQNLSPSYLGELVRQEGLIDTLVNWYPDEVSADWLEMQLGETDLEVAEDAIDQYLSRVRCDRRNCFPVREAFAEASRLARQEGNAYILIGIADGQTPDQPVNLNAIQSIEWLRVVSHEEVYPQDYYRAIGGAEYYHLHNLGEADFPRRWHKSRVLRFAGHKLNGQSLWDNAGRDDSVIERMVSAWSRWEQANGASAAMLVSYSMGVLKKQGLSRGVQDDIVSQSTDYQDYTRERLTTFSRFMSVMRVALIDKDEEEFGFVERNYSGVPDIVQTLVNALVAACDVPDFILLNRTGNSGNALSTANTAGLAQRFKEAQYKRRWCEKNFVPLYTQLARYVFRAANGPTQGQEPESWQVVSATHPTFTPLEKFEMQAMAAERDQILVGMGAIAPEEVRRQYESARWVGELSLDSDIAPDDSELHTDTQSYTPPKSAQNNAQKVLKWKKEHPDEIEGMTRIGWVRAHQLAKGSPLSLETVKRMAQFNRHRRNGILDPEHKSKPWKDAGYVAWLGWGGNAGIDWALRISKQNKNDGLNYDQSAEHLDALEWEQPSQWF